MTEKRVLLHGYAHGPGRNQISKLDKLIVVGTGIYLSDNPSAQLVLACGSLLPWRPPLAELVEAEIRRDNPQLTSEAVITHPRARGTIGEVKEFQQVAKFNDWLPSQLATMLLGPHEKRVQRIILETFGDEDGKQIEVFDAEEILAGESEELANKVSSVRETALYKSFEKSEPSKLDAYSHPLKKRVIEFMDDSYLKLIYNKIFVQPLVD